MATYDNPTAGQPSAATDASWRSWLTDYDLMLTSAGWSRAADTGMVDPVTVTYPASISTYSLPMLYYLDDALHATHPLYMKVQWGRGSTSTRVNMVVSFGYSTTGTGDLSGTVFGPYALHASTTTGDTASSALGRNWASGGEGYSTFLGGTGNWGSSSHVVSVQREFDPLTGEPSGSGNWTVKYIRTSSTGSISNSISVERATGTTVSDGGLYVLNPGSAANSADPLNVEILRHYHRLPAITVAGATCSFPSSDIAVDTTFTADVCGASRTWRTLPALRAATNTGFAVLWE